VRSALCHTQPNTDSAVKLCPRSYSLLRFQLRQLVVTKAGAFRLGYAHAPNLVPDAVCSALSRSLTNAALSGKFSENSMSPLNGSVSQANSSVHSPTHVQSSSTPPYMRQNMIFPTHSSPPVTSSSLNLNSALNCPLPSLGRSLPASSFSQPASASSSRFPIRPVGPPPSQQLLSPGVGSDVTSQFQSLLHV
jgi:hypothetical protein